MRAIRDNKVYSITETEKERYIEQGFDIYDDGGALIAHGRGKTVSIEEYERVKKELDELKAAGVEDKAGAESDTKTDTKAGAESDTKTDTKAESKKTVGK